MRLYLGFPIYYKNGVDIMKEYIPFFQAEKRSIADKLAKYYKSIGIETKINYDEVKETYILSVPSKNEKEVRKLYQDFYFAERDRIKKKQRDNEFLNEFDENNILSDTSDVLEKNSVLSDASDVREKNSVPSDTLDALEESSVTSDISDVLEESSVTSDASDEEAYLEMACDEVALGNMDDAATDTDDDTTPNNEGITHYDSNADDEAVADDENFEDDDNSSSLTKGLLSSSGASYVMKSEKYKDYISTKSVFLLLGIAGIVFVILNVLEVLTLLYGIFPNLIMGALFLFFIFVGISTGKKARILKQEILEEDQMTDKITEWLQTTVTDKFLSSITNTELSKELDYIKKTETIRDMLVAEFGEQDQDYLDRLIEDFYSETFDKNETYTESE